MAAWAAGCAAHHEPIDSSESYSIRLESVAETEPDWSLPGDVADASSLVGKALRIDFDLAARTAEVSAPFEEPTTFQIVDTDPIVLEGASAGLFGASVSADIERITLEGRIEDDTLELYGTASLHGTVLQSTSLDTAISYAIDATGSVGPDTDTPEVRVVEGRPTAELPVLMPWEPIVVHLSERVEGIPTELADGAIAVTETEPGRAVELQPASGAWASGGIELEWPSLPDRVGNESEPVVIAFWVPSSAGAAVVDFADGFGHEAEGWGSATGTAPADVACDGCASIELGGGASRGGLYARLDTPTQRVRIRYRVVAETFEIGGFTGPFYSLSAVAKGETDLVGTSAPTAAFDLAPLEPAEGAFTLGSAWSEMVLELSSPSASTEIALDARVSTPGGGTSSNRVLVLIDEITPAE